MKIPTVKSFLGCCELKTAALVRGCLCAIFYAFVTIYCLLQLVPAVLDGFLYAEMYYAIVGALLVLGVLIFLITGLVASIQLIIGVTQRNLKKIKFFMIFDIFAPVITLVINVVDLTVYSILEVIFGAYCLLVIYSLYKEIEAEHQQKGAYSEVEGGVVATCPSEVVKTPMKPESSENSTIYPNLNECIDSKLKS